MTQFYAEIQGSRGSATKTGSKSSGAWGHIRGWDKGIRVDCFMEDGRDVCVAYETGGSNNPTNIREIGRV